MKRFTTLLIFGLLTGSGLLRAQINYSFTGVSGAYTANASPTQIIAASSDEVLSSATNIGFTFQYGCQNYTQFIASSNGWMSFNTGITSANLSNNLAGTTDLPIIAPLWDDLETGTGGQVNYQLTGTAPNRVLTIEWKQMLWNYSASAWAVSFEVKLYETTNRIEFVYNDNTNTTKNVTSASASIGLTGFTTGDYYSLNGVGTSPTASKTTETSTLATKPATGQIYRWDPVLCSGTPAAGTASASPVGSCASFTTTLSLTGGANGCGITYQWQTAALSAGPYVNIGTASSTSTQTYAVTGTSYFRCISTCTSAALSATSSVVSASVSANNAGTGSYAVSLPYTATGLTTCGMGDDLTATNVPNICGSSSYYTGEDVVYIFTPATSGQLTAAITSTAGSYTGLMLYNGCPLTSAGACVANSQDYNGSRSLCTNVTGGTKYYLVLDSYASPTCNPYDISLSVASSTAIACNMAYTAASTTYSFESFTGTSTPSTDDVLYTTIVNFGFQFCFDGSQYWGGYIGSNGAFVLDAIPCYPNISSSTYAAGGVGTGYTITNPAPVNGTSVPRNAILAPWHDINPASTATVSTTKIQYTTVGTAPNRRFVLSYENIPMFSSSCETVTASNFSGQIKIFETTNTIEIHVKNKKVCSTWNNGQAIMGLHNYNGTVYIPPVNATAHNATAASPYNQWTMTNTAYKFTTSCGSTTGTCIVLPIELLYFRGNRENVSNVLRWASASETDMKEYVLERSVDGKTFTDIAHIPAKNKPSEYSYYDNDYEQGFIIYYRIREVETSGKYQQSGIIGISPLENDKFTTTHLFPNPTSNSFDIGVGSSFPGNIEINVYNAFGEKVLTQKAFLVGFNSYTVNTENLSSGLYYVEVSNEQQVVSKQKLIIRK